MTRRFFQIAALVVLAGCFALALAVLYSPKPEWLSGKSSQGVAVMPDSSGLSDGKGRDKGPHPSTGPDYSKLSDEELQAIIDKGPQQALTAAPDYSKMSDEELQAIIDKGPQQQPQDNRSFYQRNVKPFAMEMAKGVPIAGAYVPQTPEMNDFEQQNPAYASGARAAGGLFGTAVLVMMAPEAFGVGAGQTILARAGTGVLSTAALNAANTQASGGSKADVLWAAGIGATVGILPCAFGKVASPGMRLGTAQAVTGVGTPAIGASFGYLQGGVQPAIFGLLAGSIAAQHLKVPITKYLTNRAVARTLTQVPLPVRAIAPSSSVVLAKAITFTNKTSW